MVISRAIAIGNHPCDSALVKIERCNSSVGSFIYRQPIDTEATTPLLLPLPWSTWQRARSIQHRILRIRVLDQTECSRLRHGNGIVHSRFRIERSCIPIARTPPPGCTSVPLLPSGSSLRTDGGVKSGPMT